MSNLYLHHSQSIIGAHNNIGHLHHPSNSSFPTQTSASSTSAYPSYHHLHHHHHQSLSDLTDSTTSSSSNSATTSPNSTAKESVGVATTKSQLLDKFVSNLVGSNSNNSMANEAQLKRDKEAILKY
jgi:hypothetical protein